MKVILDILNSLGAIATAISVYWAIFVYIRNEERQSFSRAREAFFSLKEYISQLDGLMSESKFSMVGHCISKRVIELKPESWSLEQFTEFLEKKENHDQIAQMIHIGRLDCDFVERTENAVLSIRKSPSYLKEKFQILSTSLDKILFYIVYPGQRILSPAVFGKTLGDQDQIKESLHDRLIKHQYIKLYLNEIGLYASSVPQFLLNQDRL